MRSTTSRSITSSSTARSISSSVHPSSVEQVRAPGRAPRPGRAPAPAPRGPAVGSGTAPTLGVRRPRGVRTDAVPTLAAWPTPERTSRAAGLGLGPRAVLVPIKAFHEAKRRLRPRADARPSGPSWPGPWPTGCSTPPHRSRWPSCATTTTWPTGPARAGRWSSGSRGGASTAPSRPASTTCATPASPRSPCPTPTCPGPAGWPTSATAPGITLVPDRYGNGTNVIALPGRRRLPLLVRAGLVRPAPGRGRAARACPCGSSTCPTWPGTSTSRPTWCRWPPAGTDAP